MSEPIPTRSVTQKTKPRNQSITADICILGAGISGVTAALEAARLGKKVVLADGAPAIGGQAIGSIIGTIIGLYSHGPNAYQLTHGIADEIIDDLNAEDSILRLQGSTVNFQYNEVRLARWMERKLEEAGVHTLVGAVLTDVSFSERRIQHIDFVTRYGGLRVEAAGYIDASGDATLSYESGLEVREPVEPVWGSMNFLIEDYDEVAVKELDMPSVRQRLAEVGAKYGLVRHDGWLMPFADQGFMLANINHMQTPLDPFGAAQMVFEGRRQTDNVIAFLRAEFPAIFANAKVRVYGNPGIRQTRWIASDRQLTLADIRSTHRPKDAIARCAWWVELHDTAEVVYWEQFPDDHVYFIPLSCMIPAGSDNLLAAGRCVDADTQALSAIRVMGPCIAMGTAAAHAMHLAGTGAVRDVDNAQLQQVLSDNLDRTD